jgi:peptide/nickel transport system substrate-binding protein
MLLALVVNACGDSPTATPAATTSAAITSGATTRTVATTVAATTAASTTTQATTAAVTTTQAVTTAAVTTAASTTQAVAATTARAATKPTATQLKIAISGDENTLTPFSYVTGYPGINLLGLVYDSLYIFDPDFQPRPWLATGYKVSSDGKQYTVTLRDKVSWHDGKPLVAEDVKATYELMQKAPGNPWASGVRNITAIETPDAHTVVFTLKSANPEFILRPLADTPILPKHIWGTVKPEEAKAFTGGKIGTGPYKLADYQSGVLYRFQANESYWAGKPTVNELVVPIVKDNTTIFSSIRSGELDTSTRPVQPELIKEFEANPQLRVAKGASFGSTLLQLNASKAPFDQKDVRLAMAYAIDNQKLIDTITLGNALPGNPGFIHPASPYHNPDVKPLAYNPAKAKELLDGLGYKPGADGVRIANGTPMDYKLLVYSNNPSRVRSAEIIRDWFKEIGIKVTLQSLDPDSVDALVWPEFDVKKGRNYDLAMWGWSSSTQQSLGRIGSLFHSDTDLGSLNIGAFKNEKIDKLVEELNAAPDLAKRTEAGRKLEAAVAEELPFITLFYENGAYAFRPATYDGYVFHKLWGTIHKFSFIPPQKF